MSNNFTPRRLAVILAGVGLVASACTTGGEETTPTTGEESTDSTITGDDYTIAYESPDADDFNKLLESQEGLTNTQPVEILNLTNGDQGTLIVSFEMASHHCFGIHADLDESDNEVIIELVSGHLPGVDPNSCTVGVYPYTTAIVLDEPLGQRTVVPAEPREPIAPNESAATPGGGITGDPSDDTTPGGTPTDNTGSDNTTPENTATDGTTPSTEPGTATTLDAEAVTTTVTEAQPPTEQTAAAGPVSGANALIGSYIEDGVEWALDNGLEWRVLSFDGVPYAEPTAENTNRISFVVEADRIVRLEWS